MAHTKPKTNRDLTDKSGQSSAVKYTRIAPTTPQLTPRMSRYFQLPMEMGQPRAAAIPQANANKVHTKVVAGMVSGRCKPSGELFMTT